MIKKKEKQLVKHLKDDGKEIITITEEQVNNFAGNMLQVYGENNERFFSNVNIGRRKFNCASEPCN